MSVELLPIRRRRREGLGLLVLVLVLIGVAFGGLAAQQVFSRHAHGQALALLAHAQATETARLAIGRAFGELSRIAGDPAHPQHEELLRRLMAGGRDQDVSSVTRKISLSDLLPEAPDPALEWKRGRSAAKGPLGQASIESFQAWCEGMRPLDSLSPDEQIGLLALEASVRVDVGGERVRRRLVARHELKLTLLGPPRPFDQLGFFIQEASALLDPSKINQLRTRLIGALDELIERTAEGRARFRGDPAKDLAMIQSGLPSRQTRDTSFPPLPEERAAMIGLQDARPVPLAGLDPGSSLQEELAAFDGERRQYLDALETTEQDQGQAALDRLVTAIGSFNRAVIGLWEFRESFRLVARSDPGFENQILPFEERLSTAWYQDRVFLEVTPESPLFKDWLGGLRNLRGVFRVRSDSALVLQGALRGRGVLLVDAPEVRLQDLSPGTTGEILTILATRGTVRIEGEVQACVIASGSAVVALPPGASLRGALLIGGPARSHELAGTLSWDPQLHSGATRDEALSQPGLEAYGLAFSPVPIRTEGDRK